MVVPTYPADVSICRPRQFSLRSLFKLTLGVALILTIGVLSRGSDYFAAFASPWALGALAPVAGVWALARGGFVAPRWLPLGSVVLYGVSLYLPAVALQFNSSTWTGRAVEVYPGWAAWQVTVLGAPEVIADLFSESGWGNDTDWALAYLVGAAANIAYIGGFLAYLIGLKYPKLRRIACGAAALGCAMMVVDLALLLITGDLRCNYPAFGLWMASPLALTLGARP